MIRKTTMAIAILAVLGAVSLPAPASACPVCFGETDSPMAAGINSGIWFLLGVTGFVLSCFVALILTIWRRIRRYETRVDSLRTVVLAGEEAGLQERGL